MTDQPDLQRQQLEALEAAQQQQLDALAKLREAAMESAKYWENLAKQATADVAAEAQATSLHTATQPSPTTVTDAHFTYLEALLKAQFDFTRTLVSAPGQK